MAAIEQFAMLGGAVGEQLDHRFDGQRIANGQQHVGAFG